MRWELGQQAGGLTPPRTDSLPNLPSRKNEALSTFKVQGSKVHDVLILLLRDSGKTTPWHIPSIKQGHQPTSQAMRLDRERAVWKGVLQARQQKARQEGMATPFPNTAPLCPGGDRSHVSGPLGAWAGGRVQLRSNFANTTTVTLCAAQPCKSSRIPVSQGSSQVTE